MYTLLPPELIRLIYDFDPTYHLFFNNCISEINDLRIQREATIERINKNYWNGTMPQSVYDFHNQRLSLYNYLRKT